jgi:hypothetical protein
MKWKLLIAVAVIAAAVAVASVASGASSRPRTAGVGKHHRHPGLIDWSKITVRPNVIRSFNPSGFTYLQADCLKGEHVLSGGISVEGGVVTRSNPLYGGAGPDGQEDGWAAEVKTEPSSQTEQFADVIVACVRP